ncbi:MAG: RteC domain-containing protein [Prevotellaceae bacterium]|nr:RteC domain-containing protein [Prevotellaceae bacterium]
MNSNIQGLIKELEAGLRLKESKFKDTVNDSGAIVAYLKEGFIHLKTLVSEYGFESEEEEIHFFKKLKPELFYKMLYYHKVREYEILKPEFGHEQQRDFIKEAQANIHGFQHRHEDFMRYYKSGDTKHDKEYFLRKNFSKEGMEGLYFERDQTFSTNYDYILGKLLAAKLFNKYLVEELRRIKKEEEMGIEPHRENLPLTWTGQQSDLVELLYGVSLTGSVNNGNISIQELAASLGRIFNIELNDVYRTFHEIKKRKNDQTFFLTRMARLIRGHMEELDNK